MLYLQAMGNDTEKSFIECTDDVFNWIQTSIQILSDKHIVSVTGAEKDRLYNEVVVKMTMVKHSLLHHAGFLKWNKDGSWVISKEKSFNRKGYKTRKDKGVFRVPITQKQYDEVVRLVEDGMNIKEAIKKIGFSNTSIFYKKITAEQKDKLRRIKLSNRARTSPLSTSVFNNHEFLNSLNEFE